MCATCIVALGRKGSNLSFAVHGARRVPHQGRQAAHQGQQAAAPKDIEDWVRIQNATPLDVILPVGHGQHRLHGFNAASSFEKPAALVAIRF